MGTIYVVATPIGNLEDITLRAKHVLREVDVVVAEDTRVTRKLLHHLGVKQEIVRYDDTMTERQAEKLAQPVLEGKHVALVTDAGTPNVSDPGWRFIRAAQKLSHGDVRVIPVPGASALTTLLSVAHFPLNSFVFLGFPPSKKGRQTFFSQIGAEERPVVLYEAPHRIVKTLKALGDVVPKRDIVVGKELTKLYEKIWRGSTREIADEFAMMQQDELKGEFVLVISSQKYGKK